MNRPQTINLPVGEKPGWELEDTEKDTDKSLGLKSIADR
jgi:hypothetical protein